MTDNENRAHDIAIAALPALILNHQDRMNNLPGPVRGTMEKLDIYKAYKEVYDSCLNSLSEESNK